MATFEDFAKKKVAGVPVLYLGAAAAVILAIVAWRMKSSPEVADTPGELSEGEDAVLDENGWADGSDPYAGLKTNGTVIVQPAPDPPEVEDTRPQTNDEWIRQGAEWLNAEKGTSGQAAFTALSKYVEGRDRSLTEQQMVDWVIKQFGYPPDNFTETPVTPTPTPNAPVPAPAGPRGYGWHKANGKRDATTIAKMYKIPVSQYYSWNPTLPKIPKNGTWVKVRDKSNPQYGYKGV